jgi:pimeloyl-ACP methyl ester carboxylesterase
VRLTRIVPGIALVAVPVLVTVTRWDPLVANHPAYPITLGLATVLGLLLIITGMTTHEEPRRGVVRTFFRIAAAAAGVGLAAGLYWNQPFPATDRALEAMESDDQVAVVEDRSQISFDPAQPYGAGLVIYPGARVDPRAYAVLARGIAEAGHEVIVLKCAFDTALLCTSAAADVTDRREVWAVGGHSLGGVAASAFVNGNPAEAEGLLLWAAWPFDDMSGSAVEAASVFGSEDGIATPQEIRDEGEKLPEGATFVEIDGAVHSFFGDYGDQPGDGTPTVPREVAQEQIIEASVALLDAVDTAQR